ncbi:hypothetical protein IMZ08_03375 [Bacillus luteolus]|uniref:SbsC C-terminal domain-containing protein n=1 Tax=Litchfieldia luteola TaxID=682179 RepID=A0ABR9QF24_9BACI|nr:hypothetical protein [Cytobacillus luteolus]MBE4907098.1 hypothetical protein [Cytobacillus luteolus]MBP1943435.1 hypothetical protein [Cytobacillus luteolus]
MKKQIIVLSSMLLFLFTLAFLPVDTAEASVTAVEKLVKQAEANGAKLKKEISVEYTKGVKIPDQKLYNATKDSLHKAMAEVNKLSASQKQAYEKRLKDNVEVHYIRAQAYIDAMVSGNKIVAKTNQFNALYADNPLTDQTEAAYHALTSEIRKQAKLLYRVYGKSTREAILAKYKGPAEKAKNDSALVISAKMTLDKLITLVETDANEASITKQLELLDGFLNKIKNQLVVSAINDLLSEYFFTEEEMAVFELIERNVDVFNNEDVDGYMADLASDYPNLAQTKATIEGTFAMYDLLAELFEIDILEITEDTASVRIVLQTTSLVESDFKDNVVEFVQVVKKENGKWVLTDQVEILAIEYLE